MTPEREGEIILTIAKSIHPWTWRKLNNPTKSEKEENIEAKEVALERGKRAFDALEAIGALK